MRKLVHNFIFIEKGGYYYRLYPQNLLGISELHSVHGIFMRKSIEKNEYIIEIQSRGEICITDDVAKVSERRQLISDIKINVPKKLWEYPFIPEMPYKLTAEGAFLLC